MTEAERLAVQLEDSLAWSSLALVQAHAKATRLRLTEIANHIEQVQIRLGYIHHETQFCVEDGLPEIIVVGFL